MYLRAIILLSFKVIVKSKDKNLNFSSNLSFKNELLNIKKTVQILIITNFIMHFRQILSKTIINYLNVLQLKTLNFSTLKSTNLKLFFVLSNQSSHLVSSKHSF